MTPNLEPIDLIEKVVMKDADKRNPDGTWIWCDAVSPDRDSRGRAVHCAEVIRHEGDHVNGTWRWAPSAQ
jgi:hypothetical protein